MDRLFYNIRIFLTALVNRPIEWILQYVLGIQDSSAQSIEAQNVCRVQIKAPNRTIPLVLQSSWSISDVKNQLAAIMDVEPDSLGIILAGRELDDKVEIASCDLGMNTIIHAVHIVHKKPKQPLNEELVDLQITGEERKKEAVVKAQFFVYCKDCKPNYLQTGRLRTRCKNCKETSIIIHRDPCGWSDVLDQPGTINGHCLNSLCSTTAEQAAPVEVSNVVKIFLVTISICFSCTFSSFSNAMHPIILIQMPMRYRRCIRLEPIYMMCRA